MANYDGAARTNYVHITDLEGLKKAISPFSLAVHEKDGRYCLLSDDADTGGWPGYGLDEETDEEVDFDTATMIMPFVAEGEVLIIMEAGHEKLRYVSGWAQAWIRRGDDVQDVDVSLNDIYRKAAREFKVPESDITEATY